MWAPGASRALKSTRVANSISPVKNTDRAPIGTIRYDPNADLFASENGRLVPRDQSYFNLRDTRVRPARVDSLWPRVRTRE